MKVLIADDSPTARFALRKNLTSWGYEVVEASEGKKAWSLLNEADPPRIAVLDWMMPGLDGVEICRKLRERANGPFVYTILLTSKNEQEDLVYGLENGAHNFQSKPYSPIELRSHINVGKRLVESDDKIKEYAEEMERLATTDSLTGIFNRRHFLELGEKEMSRTQRYFRPMSVLLIDVDHFKNINDTFGHAAGDKTLKILTETCINALRENDLFGRLGGEEFAVILPENDEKCAADVAERLRKTMEELKITIDDKMIRFTISIGVASHRTNDKSIENILKRADDALYKAKKCGRNRVVSDCRSGGCIECKGDKANPGIAC